MNALQTKKKILIVVQAVDLDDSLMGFFVPWLEEAAKQFEHVTVLALRVGRYVLPENVTVIPLRPKASGSRLAVIKNLLSESWCYRNEYDAVFVRGDSSYVIITAWLWRILQKKIVFWYAHYRVSLWTVLASACASATVTSVKAAYDHPLVHPIAIGQNIDPNRFSLRTAPITQTPMRFLVFGRIMPIKRLEEVIDAFIESGCGQGATLTIGGPATDPAYAESIRVRIKNHPSVIWDARSIPYDQAHGYLSRFDVLLSACPGSLDKVIVESAMTGLITIAATVGMKEWLAPEDVWLMTKTKEDFVSALKKICVLSLEDRAQIVHRLRDGAFKHHTVQSQITRIAALI